MSSYFIWDGSPEIFALGIVELPFDISIIGLILAGILYFFGMKYASESGQKPESGKKRRKKQSEPQEVSTPIFIGIVIGSILIGQLVTIPIEAATFSKIGPIAVRWYGLLFAISFLLGYYIGSKAFEHAGKPQQLAESLFMYLILGTVLGARLGHVLFYDFDYYSRNLHEVLYFWQGGLASHGAFIGVLLSIWIYTKKNAGVNFIWVTDRIALPFALGGMFVRIGNFFNSEILGRETDVSWAVIFTSQDLIPRHPSMLYEAACYFVLFLILVAVYRFYRNSPPLGALTGLFMVGIFLARFFIEYTKERQPGFDETLTFLSMGQLLSIPLVLIGLWILVAKVDWRSSENK